MDAKILAYSDHCFGAGGWISLLVFCLDINRKRAKKYEHEEGLRVFKGAIRRVLKLNELFDGDVDSELRMDDVEEFLVCIEGLRAAGDIVN